MLGQAAPRGREWVPAAEGLDGLLAVHSQDRPASVTSTRVGVVGFEPTTYGSQSRNASTALHPDGPGETRTRISRLKRTVIYR